MDSSTPSPLQFLVLSGNELPSSNPSFQSNAGTALGEIALLQAPSPASLPVTDQLLIEHKLANPAPEVNSLIPELILSSVMSEQVFESFTSSVTSTPTTDLLLGETSVTGLVGIENYDSWSVSSALEMPVVDEIVFIDSKVENYESLIEGVITGVEVVVLDPNRDGVEQIDQVLAGRQGISSVSIISHGEPGQLSLGATQLTADNLTTYASTLQRWAESLTADADILLYGCDVAAGDRGLAFVQELSNLTGADVAASSDRTGSAALAGNWDLEVVTGAIEAGNILQPQTKVTYNSVFHADHDHSSDPTAPATETDDQTDSATSNPSAGVDERYTVSAAATQKDKEKKAKEKKAKKEKNKIKNKFAGAKLSEILGDTEVIRINAGGRHYTDNLGKVWAADTNFTDGAIVDTLAEVKATKDSELYQSGRRGSDFFYQLPVKKGTYQVNLSFVEDPYITGAKQRVFDVLMEDQVVLNDLDIWSEIGTTTALNKSVEVAVTDGFLDIDFSSVIGDAKVEAIEVTRANKNDKNKDKGKKDKPKDAPLVQANDESRLVVAAAENVAIAAENVTPTVLINSGGKQYTDNLGKVWSADQYFTTSRTHSTTQGITGTSNPTLYQTERYEKSFGYNIPVPTGSYKVNLNFAEIYWNGPGLRVFDVAAEGKLAIDDLDIWSEVGAKTALTKTVEVAVTDGILNLDFSASVNAAKISSIEVLPNTEGHGGHPFLHVVIGAPSWVVDYEGNGKEVVALQGSGSHTHEFGRKLNAFTWKDGSTLLGNTVDIQAALALGKHQVSLTIGDDGSPPETLTDAVPLSVFPINAVGGMLTKYYPGASISSLPTSPSFVEIIPTLRLEEVENKIGTSSITGNTAIVMNGKLAVTTGGSYNFTVKGGSSSQLYLNGALVSGPINLTAEQTYTLEARVARDAAATAPVEILASINGAPAVSLNPNNLTHDQRALKPFINGLSTSKGSQLGGQPVTINGVAFFDGDASSQVKVHWGNTILSGSSILVKQGAITLLTPPGSGTVAVKIETPNGISAPTSFTYEGSTVPISFSPEQAITNATPDAPTQAEWGPDGRLYVGSISGEITIYTFDDGYNVVGTQVVKSLTGLSNSNILGIAFNPFDSSGSPKIYVAHSQLFANGGGAFTGPSPYSGQVSILSGSNFSTVTPLVTGLPVSNHDHGVNGLAFDNKGDLLIASGGNTNAGVKDPDLGDLPESPFSAAVLKAKVTDSKFNGTIKYAETATGAANNDQVYGEVVDSTSGTNLSVYANGFRNPFDIVWTTRGKLFGTDNGPNKNYGAASTSATTQTTDPSNPDEINLLTPGGYYGHPNRNRGRYDNRQNVYQGPTSPATSTYTPPLKTVSPSSNGITEYRASTFGGQMQGNLLVQKWNGQLYNAKLSQDGTQITTMTQLTGLTSGLDVVAGPGGALLGIDYTDDAITLSVPNDSSVIGATAYDIFPWRAPAVGGNSFVIGGKNFGSLSNTTVTIGGKTAVLTSVSPTRIKGIIPAQAATGALVDVVINSASKTSLLPGAFLYLADGTTPSTSNPGTLAFSASGFSVNEDGTPGAVVTVTRTGGSSGAVSATITPGDGTATAPGDYNKTPIVVNFASGDTTAKSVIIPIVDDQIVEPSETINLTLGSATGGATLGTQKTATLTIVDNDSLNPVRVEAESLSLTTYRVESNSSASSGKLISLHNGDSLESGTASFNFAGPSGNYNVVVGYYDENDGIARLSVKLGDTILDSWNLDKNLSSNLANAQTLTKRTVATGLSVTKGALFTLMGTETQLEHARIDYIEFIPVTTSGSDAIAPTASLTTGNITQGGGGSHNFTVTYADNVAVNVSKIDNSDIRVTGPKGFNQLATLVGVNLASNGSPRTATYKINAPGGSWDGTDSGTYTVSMEPNQVSDTNNKSVASGSLGTFTVNIAPFRVEAETATATTYRVESSSVASGGKVLSLNGGASSEVGTASFTLPGPAGTYNIVIGYYDENDGTSRLEAKLGGTVLDTWNLNQNLGSDAISAQNLVRRTIATGRSLASGAVIEIKGTENQGEYARIDYIDFIPVTSTSSAPLTTPGIWDTAPLMPNKLGEVAAGVINGVLYMVGETSNATLAYDIASGTWRNNLAPRPLVGHHHAAEVVDGKLYIIGGLGSGAGKVQIYDPVTNSWKLGNDMPFAAGSSSSAVINGQIYVTGGIIGSSTTTQSAKYNPATNVWTAIAPMKQGRNHAASATDGTKLYVFGGRGPGSGDSNTVANGFDTVQIYNPATNTWVSSLDSGSTIAPLPQARGGMGKAVYFNGEFYVMGGETQTGAGATDQKVYNRVDIYNPLTNTWRLGKNMPTARHGIFPVAHAGEIFVAGGGLKAGFASSDILEIF